MAAARVSFLPIKTEFVFQLFETNPRRNQARAPGFQGWCGDDFAASAGGGELLCQKVPAIDRRAVTTARL
ncbi:MAG TPA: hypothetical protein VGK00_04975 [Anaerolineales bacterium]